MRNIGTAKYQSWVTKVRKAFIRDSRLEGGAPASVRTERLTGSDYHSLYSGRDRHARDVGLPSEPEA